MNTEEIEEVLDGMRDTVGEESYPLFVEFAKSSSQPTNILSVYNHLEAIIENQSKQAATPLIMFLIGCHWATFEAAVTARMENQAQSDSKKTVTDEQIRTALEESKTNQEAADKLGIKVRQLYKRKKNL